MTSIRCSGKRPREKTRSVKRRGDVRHIFTAHRYYIGRVDNAEVRLHNISLIMARLGRRRAPGGLRNNQQASGVRTDCFIS